MIPGLENAEFLRLGQIHRNTYINAPQTIEPRMAARRDPRVFFAGQLAGTEGYIENVASGLVAGINAVRRLRGEVAIDHAGRNRDRRFVPIRLDAAKTFRADEHQLRTAAANCSDAANCENRQTAPVVRACPGTMQTRININGVITAAEEAKISVLDHGLLFGDSVYETLRTYQGKPFLFSRHFARLEHSAQGFHLRLPWSKDEDIRANPAHADPRRVPHPLDGHARYRGAQRRSRDLY